MLNLSNEIQKFTLPLIKISASPKLSITLSQSKTPFIQTFNKKDKIQIVAPYADNTNRKKLDFVLMKFAFNSSYNKFYSGADKMCVILPYANKLILDELKKDLYNRSQEFVVIVDQSTKLTQLFARNNVEEVLCIENQIVETKKIPTFDDIGFSYIKAYCSLILLVIGLNVGYIWLKGYAALFKGK